MTEEEIKTCKMKFQSMFEELRLRFPTCYIEMPNFETNSPLQIYNKYETVLTVIGEYQHKLQLQKTNYKTLFSNIDSIFPSGETTFDYTTGIFREIIISQVLLLNDISVPSYAKLMETLNEKICSCIEKDKNEIERLTISMFLWLMVYLMMMSPDTPINKSILDKGLIIVESEDFTTSTTTTKTINSGIFNGEKLSTTTESTKLLKVITKIIVKDRNSIWEIISTCIPRYEVLVSSEI
jgi:hypothetical protein